MKNASPTNNSINERTKNFNRIVIYLEEFITLKKYFLTNRFTTGPTLTTTLSSSSEASSSYVNKAVY